MIGKAWRSRFGEVDFVDGSGAECDFWSGRGLRRRGVGLRWIDCGRAEGRRGR